MFIFIFFIPATWNVAMFMLDATLKANNSNCKSMSHFRRQCTSTKLYKQAKVIGDPLTLSLKDCCCFSDYEKVRKLKMHMESENLKQNLKVGSILPPISLEQKNVYYPQTQSYV